MGVLYAYHDGGQRTAVTDPVAYPGGIAVPVRSVWAYHTGGTKTLVWARSPADLAVSATQWDTVQVDMVAPGSGADSLVLTRNGSQIYSGAVKAQHIDTALNPATAYTYQASYYRGGSLAGEASGQATTPARLAPTFSATPSAWNAVALSWSDAAKGSIDQYRVKRSGTAIYTGSGSSHSDTGRSASTTYNYTLESLRAGAVVLPTPADSATTPARPTVTNTITLSAVGAGSWNGSGNLRTSSACYYGYYSSTHGYQRSLVSFNIPSDVRNCISISDVQFSWYNSHHYYNSGGKVSMVLHHGYFTTAPATFPGSTGVLTNSGGSQITWTAPKPGWFNGTQWNSLTNLKTSRGHTVQEEFRTKGAVGLGLYWATTGQNGYGYAQTNPQLKITYTKYA